MPETPRFQRNFARNLIQILLYSASREPPLAYRGEGARRSPLTAAGTPGSAPALQPCGGKICPDPSGTARCVSPQRTGGLKAPKAAEDSSRGAAPGGLAPPPRRAVMETRPRRRVPPSGRGQGRAPELREQRRARTSSSPPPALPAAAAPLPGGAAPPSASFRSFCRLTTTLPPEPSGSSPAGRSAPSPRTASPGPFSGAPRRCPHPQAPPDPTPNPRITPPGAPQTTHLGSSRASGRG